MFINCPYCRALVATDPVTDEPPTHCPHCDSLLRRDPAADADADTEAQAEPPALDLAALLAMPADAPIATSAAPAAQADATTDATSDTTAHATADTTDASAIEPRAQPEDARTDTPVVTGEPVAVAATAAATVASAPMRMPRKLPSFLRSDGDRAPRPRERWLPTAVIALALLLALQLLLADRARLAADAHWRPVLHALCTALRCDLPPWREPSAFTLLQRDVRQHPQLPGALRVTSTFRNDARWSQPWPQLQLRLTDGNGRNAGERSFRAEEYLGGPPDQAELGSGETASVAMDILEPAPGIVGYDFSFR
jgi:hypothetical protein